MSIRILTVLAVLLAAGCAATPTVPSPHHPESSGLAIYLKVRISGIATYRADTVYFVKRCPAGESCDERLLPSSYSKEGRVYLLNVEPGEYLAVAAAFESGMPGDKSIYFAYFPDALINRIAVTVGTRDLAYAGAYLVSASMGVCPDNAEPGQMKYAQIIEPDTPKCGFWQPLMHKLAKADFIFVGGKAYSVGKQTFHYRGVAYEVIQKPEEFTEFFERARSDLGDAGWQITR